ncbi:hypothetical protein C8Q77DRAFT_1139512 [Trametes polyzona]|nr:hypothetical protein C8Q77DRAFT_1139512 [Trametes polyzona]
MFNAGLLANHCYLPADPPLEPVPVHTASQRGCLEAQPLCFSHRYRRCTGSWFNARGGQSTVFVYTCGYLIRLLHTLALHLPLPFAFTSNVRKRPDIKRETPTYRLHTPHTHLSPMSCHTNIEHAIVAVKERGHELTVPNVLAAYIHCVAAHIPPEDATDENAIAQAAITLFERAMDKYPAPAPPAKAKATSKAQRVARPTVAEEAAKDVLAKRMFCAEVAQLRGEYYQALWRPSDSAAGYQGCKCLSCGCLLKVRSSEVRKLDSPGEDDASEARPVRKRRVRKTAVKKRRAVNSVPFDPYAPSTSRAAI